MELTKEELFEFANLVTFWCCAKDAYSPKEIVEKYWNGIEIK